MTAYNTTISSVPLNHKHQPAALEKRDVAVAAKVAEGWEVASTTAVYDGLGGIQIIDTFSKPSA